MGDQCLAKYPKPAYNLERKYGYLFTYYSYHPLIRYVKSQVRPCPNVLVRVPDRIVS